MRKLREILGYALGGLMFVLLIPTLMWWVSGMPNLLAAPVARMVIGIVLAVLLVIAILVLRIVMPNEMSAIFDQIWAWLNQPLPIVGVSSIVLGFTIWKIFISTSFGKKCVAELEKKFNELKADYEAKLKEAEEDKALELWKNSI